MDCPFLVGHQITLWKDIWRCTIVRWERVLPGECPSEWAHLALEPDECFYPQWGWDERWAVPALQCANESHLTGCPMIREAAPQRKSSYLRTNWKKKPKVFTETIWNLLYNWLLLSCIKYLTYYITVWSLDRGSECFTDGQASNTLKVTLKIQITVTLCCSLFWENSQSLARLKDSHVLLSQRPCETVLSELLIFISLFENVIFLKINIIMDHPIMNSLSIFSYQKNPSYIPL